MATAKQKGSSSSSFETLPTGGKVFILVLIFALVGALYFFIFHMPLSEDLEAAQAQYVTLQTDLRAAEQRQQEYLQLTQELANREAIDRANKRVLPQDAEIPAFLQDLNRVAELSGLDIRLVEPRPEESEPLYVRIPVALRVSGKFHQVAKFFYSVSRLERAINMENIQLRDPTMNEADEVLLVVDALATTFRSAEVVTPGQPAQPVVPGRP
ncbi:MAG: type 4a pilus biogenesis protein PilO [Sandaracinus sp.]|nr:type 4a pilus biogenesis protein PilO [Sandaracinus sp.]MCB9619290.1 type 4a pilus biogenesis protein PilO [Sandaracinus sp.]